jgi:hypothetical protein
VLKVHARVDHSDVHIDAEIIGAVDVELPLADA